ncbi:hypothetical protein [Corynebacterium sp. AOP12-C2-36]|uniref:hypothetical protein n=1 Tax=Corynebacterium sp. AOP12-C2-36 TaxID=3457723 RepID=UPI00403362E2
MGEFIAGIFLDLTTLSAVAAGLAAVVWAAARLPAGPGTAAALGWRTLCWSPVAVAIVAAGWLGVAAAGPVGPWWALGTAAVMAAEGAAASALVTMAVRWARSRPHPTSPEAGTGN